jgi:hypothetical protein
MLTPGEILVRLRENPRPHLLLLRGNVAMRLCYLYRASLPERFDPELPLGYEPGEVVHIYGLYSPSAKEWLEISARTLGRVLHNVRPVRLIEDYDEEG